MRRDLQNEECAHIGFESLQARAECEDKIALVDVVLYQANPFIENYLISMLGAPDVTPSVFTLLRYFVSPLDAILGPLGIPNPLKIAYAEISEGAKNIGKEQLRLRTGIDVDLYQSVLKHPSHYLALRDPLEITLPEPVGAVRIELFEEGDHDRLDAIMGMGAGHHVLRLLPVLGASSALTDLALFDPARFAPLKNTITTSKLLLLDGSTLNAVLADILLGLGRIKDPSLVQAYQDGLDVPANVMIDALDNDQADGIVPDPWLRSIDSDHAWREDGEPRFARESGGNGRFPIWESCILRPAFRALFTDWENGSQNFPDLEDASDPVTCAPPSGTSRFPGSSPQITKPTDPTLLGSTVDFEWTDGGLPIKYWWLNAGSAPGRNDYHEGEWIIESSTRVSTLPTDGRKVYVRLHYWLDKRVNWVDAACIAFSGEPEITKPTDPTLPGATVDFEWTDNGLPVTHWWLMVGSAPGGDDFHKGEWTTGSSTRVTTLSTDGSKVYVRLNYWTDKANWVDVVYTAFSGEPEITKPTDPALLGSTINFEWTDNGLSIGYWWLMAGSAPGGNDYHKGEWITGSSARVSTLPADGSKVYVRLNYWTDKAHWVDVVYTAFSGQPKITKPTDPTLRGSTVYFEWTDNGLPVTQWRLIAGSYPGGDDYHNGEWITTASTVVSTLPTGAQKVYIRLHYLTDKTQWIDAVFSAAAPTPPRVTSHREFVYVGQKGAIDDPSLPPIQKACAGTSFLFSVRFQDPDHDVRSLRVEVVNQAGLVEMVRVFDITDPSANGFLNQLFVPPLDKAFALRYTVIDRAGNQSIPQVTAFYTHTFRLRPCL